MTGKDFEMKRTTFFAALLAVACLAPCAAWADDGLNAYDGIYEYGGRTETWYSSEVAYHWQTPEWWVDDEGFYRTPEGYYVIAASDYEQGEVIEGSKGLCQVLDCGCDARISDYYVNWSM